MRIDLISLFPEFVAQLAGHGVVARAAERGLLSLHGWNPRDYAEGGYRRVDDRPFGGGPGMVMLIEPLRATLRAARGAAPAPARVIYLSPQGRRLDQAKVRELAAQPRLVLLCGRYEGVDDRDAAEALRGTEVWVPRAVLPPPAPGEYYWVDLEGLRVVNAEGVALGTVSHLFSTAANDVLVVQGERERMIPFVQPDFIRSVDFDAGVVTVDWDADF